MSEAHFRLPDVGEGLTEAEIVSWKVAVGDRITMNQVIVEIETAKSLVELPSPFAGLVGGLLVAEGDTVEVGTPIITVTDAVGDLLGAPSAAPTPSASAPASAGAAEVSQAERDTADTVASEESGGAVLVGHGASGPAGTRRRRTVGPVSTAAHSALALPAPTRAKTPAPQVAERSPRAVAASTGPVIAKPPIRKLAKDLGVDLGAVTATGPIGDVTRDDVLGHAGQATVFSNLKTPAWSAQREERLPVKGVRKVIAQSMVSSAFSAPHVSLFVDVDASRTMEFVKRLKASSDFAGVRVSPLLIMARAIIWAVRRNPTVNAQWTDTEIIVKHFVNLGIAAATPRGLIVPNVKDAQRMSLLRLAQALEQLTLSAREGKTQPSEMQNGTITITNIGVFGMDTGTPILNLGEVAIVALGAIKQKPWVVDGEVRPRWVTTIGASFDHRVVDGDVASRFLADVASIVEEPALLLD